MSWIRRVTVICDSCFEPETPPLNFSGGDSLHRVLRTAHYKAEKVDGAIYHLCPGCYDLFIQIDHKTRAHRLANGLHLWRGERDIEGKRQRILNERERQERKDREESTAPIEATHEELEQ